MLKKFLSLHPNAQLHSSKYKSSYVKADEKTYYKVLLE